MVTPFNEVRLPSLGQGTHAGRPACFGQLAQAQFVEEKTPAGKSRFIPGSAELTIAYGNASLRMPEVLDDLDSNVFQKTIPPREADSRG